MVSDRRRLAASHPLEVKAANLDRVLRAALGRRGPFTRGDLTSDTGLSAPTLGGLLTDLFRLDLVRVVGSQSSTGGRRPSLIEFNPRCGFLVGLDIGPGETRIALADLRQELLAHRILRSGDGVSPRQFLANLIHDLHTLMAEVRLARDRLLAVGVGAAGVVNEESGNIVTSRAPGWRDVPLRDILQDAFSCPVTVGTRVNMAMVAEHERGAARGHDVCACILAGPEVSAAIYARGHVHRGHTFMAGRLDAMRAGPSSLEAMMGDRSRPDGVATGSARSDLAENVRAIGVAAAYLAAFIDPSVIVIGGPLLAEVPSLISSVVAIVQSLSSAPVAVLPSALGDEATLWGGLATASEAALERLRKELRDLPPSLP